MKKFKTRSKSFVKTCIFYFVIYSFVVLGLYMLFSVAVNAKLANSFPTLDSLLEYDEALRSDDFAAVPYLKFKNCDYIVFNEENQPLYSTNTELQDFLKKTDLQLIPDADNNKHYQFFQSVTPEGEVRYNILLNVYNAEDGEWYVANYCTMDENYQIIAGGLFPEKKALTDQEITLIRGGYKEKKNIEKYTYFTNDGEQRLLIFVSPQVTTMAYGKLLRETDMLWWIFLPLLLLVVVVQSVLFSRNIRRSAVPFEKAIASYAKGERINIPLSKIPREFKPVIQSFESLLDKLERTRREKDHEVEEKYRMIANVSHDLKTPLTVIQGYAKAFLDGIVQPEKEKPYLQAIYHKAEESAEMMDTLFAYTKLEHPEYTLHTQEVDFSEFCRTYLSEKYDEFQMRGFSLEPEIPEEAIFTKIDPNLMRRVFDNLTENTMKHNEQGTTIYFLLQSEKTKLRLLVADNGCGISEEIRETVFEPFVTGNSARTSGSGTGLGMGITQKIVELHNGTIRLVNPPENGWSTEFEIRLPLL